MYELLFKQFKKELTQVDLWLDMAAEFAKTKSFDVNTLLTARLAPDQFPLVRQIQTACDTAKLACARVTGKDAPSHPDTETTVEQLKARIASVLAYLNGFSAKDFEGADSRKVSQPRWEGKHMLANEYFVEHALPNFFFHLSHTYAILRHNGVPLGKKNFLGTLSLRD